jgi:nickel transport protein
MKKKLYLILIFLFLTIIMINISAFAHKVNIFAYVEGDKVYTESYFSDGKKCVESKIEVFDNQGDKLLEGLTDKEGMFSFKISPEDVIDGNLKLVLTASMGHRAEYIIRADELGDIKGIIEEKIEEPVSLISPETSSVDLKEIQSIIEDTLGEKLKPIIREIREIKKSQEDRISPTEIIGGIGYIIGIFGIVAYFLSRKR